MSNAATVAIYASLAACTALTMILTLCKKERGHMDMNLLFAQGMIMCWLLASVAFFACPDIELSRYLFDFKLPFVALTAVSWFLYIVRFYGLRSYFPPAVVATLFVIPAFTVGLVLTSPHHDFVRTKLDMLQATPEHIYSMERGLWFWYHSVFCYLIMLAAFGIAIVQHLKSPKEYRLPSTLLMLGLSVGLGGNILVLASDIRIDLSLITATATAIILYFATQNYQGMDFFIRARNEAFHYLDKSIFILDDERSIVSMNRTARLWLMENGFTEAPASFQSVLDDMLEHSTRLDALEDLESGTDYYFQSGQVYNLRLKPIFDNRGNILGSFAFISNETENRELIRYLDKHSGMDALTGLSNRRQMEVDLEQLDKKTAYPLAVFVGDLNGLKETNDKLGHQQGDTLLRVTAETLKATCPPGARIARTGGDEFIILLPEYTTSQAERLAKDIKQALPERSRGYPFTASISLGFSIKEAPGQSIKDVMRAADTNMYLDKEKNKSRRSSRKHKQKADTSA